jgi:hypothetical protein
MLRAILTAFCVLAAALFACAANLLAQQMSAGVQSSEGPNGVITGRVVNSAGEPLAGASVSAGPIAGNAPRKTATADGHGDFKIDGLEPALYTISALMPGYVYSFLPTPSDSPTYYRIGDSVRLTLTKGGVITGSVTGPNGPVIGVGVFATRVRDSQGKMLGASPGFPERRTDDRGVFRFYGLAPGAYLLSVAKPRLGTILPSAYDNDVPTYYPSATRDTASEIIVRESDEITADIRYRAETGHAVSGKLTGMIQSQTQFSSGISIMLTDVRDRTQIANTGTDLADESSFAFYGVPDGEYEVSARQFLPTRQELRSQPQRVSVHGANITGIALALAPLASIEGGLVFENDPKAACAKRRDTAAQETIVYARRYDPENKTGTDAKTDAPKASLYPVTYSTFGVADAKGSFKLRNLPSGSYRIDPRPPASGWYVRSIAIGAAQPAAARAASLVVARDGITLKSGERASGLTITIAEGAASLRGRLTVAEGQSLSLNLRIYLVPAEKESSDNVLGFFETRTESDGSFAIGNIAPGRYWVLERAADESDPATAKPIRQDPALRSQVLKEAQKTRNEIQLEPCQRIVDYEMRYPQATADTKP